MGGLSGLRRTGVSVIRHHLKSRVARPPGGRLATMDRSIHERILVPAREGRAVPVPVGGQFLVVNVEGQQVGDLFAFSARDVGEYVSAEHTRVGIARLFPRVGEAFLTNRRRPILTLLAEDSPGVNDMLMAACDPERYRLLGVTGWHA